MTVRSALAVTVLAVLVLVACSKPLDPPPAPPQTITQATFEPVYRASKAIQGALGPGVTYAKFGELLQGLSTEIAIAKDHQMNEFDKELITLYDEALTAYKYSALLWKLKNDAHDDMWKGEIPVEFSGKRAAEMEPGLTKYGLVPAERTVRHLGTKYKALPAEAIQVVWQKADGILKQATEIYYGRAQRSSVGTK